MAPKHLHHVRSHHVCSPPMMASEVLGLYLVSAKGERTAICDIHQFGASLDNNWHNTYYTGPGKKAMTAMRHERTDDDDALFDLHGLVTDDIVNGGIATFVYSKKRRSFDIWLFGPLSLLGRPYGSLIVELAHYAERKIFTMTEKDRSTKSWTKFGEVPAGFNPCKVMHTTYHPQVGGRGQSADTIALRAVRANGLPLVPLGPHMRAEWKVLSRIVGQTDCQLYQQEGV